MTEGSFFVWLKHYYILYNNTIIFKTLALLMEDDHILLSFFGINELEHRRTGRGGEGGCSPPKFWATKIFWAARENLGKARRDKYFLF